MLIEPVAQQVVENFADDLLDRETAVADRQAAVAGCRLGAARNGALQFSEGTHATTSSFTVGEVEIVVGNHVGRQNKDTIVLFGPRRAPALVLVPSLDRRRGGDRLLVPLFLLGAGRLDRLVVP